jgi:prevent-host-death family protein
MKEIGAFEAKNKLGTLLDWVAAGEEVLITRRGKPVAKLVPSTASREAHVAAEAAARIRARAAALRSGRFNWSEWKGYRDQTRP